MHPTYIYRATLLVIAALAVLLLSPSLLAHSGHDTATYYSYDDDGNIVTARNSELQQRGGNSIERYFMGQVVSRLSENTPSVTFILMAIAFVLGVIHTLTPGHGKAVIASYLAGNDVKFKDTVVLGVTTAVTHVLDVFIIMIVFMFVLKNTDIAPFSGRLAVISACLIAAFGGYGLNDAWKEFRHYRAHETAGGDGHSENHDHHHHHHTHDHSQKKGRPFILGILLGLAPCPMAWIIFLLALSLNRIVMGFMMMIAFSVAIIITTLLLSLLILKFKEKVSSQRSLPVILPVLSYLFMVCLGIMIALGN